MVGPLRRSGCPAGRPAACTLTGPKLFLTVQVTGVGAPAVTLGSSTVAGSTVTPCTLAVSSNGLLQRRRRTPRLDLELPDAGHRVLVRPLLRLADGGVREVGVAGRAGGALDRHAPRVDRDPAGLRAGRDAGQVDLQRRRALRHGDEERRWWSCGPPRPRRPSRTPASSRTSPMTDGVQHLEVDDRGLRVVDPQDGAVHARPRRLTCTGMLTALFSGSETEAGDLNVPLSPTQVSLCVTALLGPDGPGHLDGVGLRLAGLQAARAAAQRL